MFKVVSVPQESRDIAAWILKRCDWNMTISRESRRYPTPNTGRLYTASSSSCLPRYYRNEVIWGHEANRMHLVHQYKVLMSSYWTWCGAFQQNSSICIRNGPCSPENLGDLRRFVTSRSSGSFRSAHTSLRWTSDRFYFASTCTNLISSCQKKKKSFPINILMLISHHIARSKLWRMWYVCLSSKRKLRKIYISAVALALWRRTALKKRNALGSRCSGPLLVEV